MKKGSGSGSISQRYGSADPDGSPPKCHRSPTMVKTHEESDWMSTLVYVTTFANAARTKTIRYYICDVTVCRRWASWWAACRPAYRPWPTMTRSPSPPYSTSRTSLSSATAWTRMRSGQYLMDQMSAFLKNLLVKVLGGRCLSVWIHIRYPCTYLHRKWGEVRVGEPVRR